MATLGVFCTGFGFVLFFGILTRAGAGFVSMNNFLVPPFSVFYGHFVLAERLPVSAFAAMALILLGLAVQRLQTKALKSQNVLHGIEPRLAPHRPACRGEGAAGEDLAAGRLVGELDALAFGPRRSRCARPPHRRRAARTKPIAPFLRAPVTPSRPRSADLSRSTPRPAAAARPKRSAVPEGASTLWR